jgi:A/G-specific adenine glycosylase
MSGGRRTRFAADLLRWYDRHRRALPWRETPSPYRTLVSELMLQQTVVATVIPYFQRFCARFPSLEALAAASEDEVLEAWSGLGYYRRARHLHAAARAIVEGHAGVVPREERRLRELPGLGPYTAAAVAAIAYDEPAFALDGNAGRVMARLSADREAPSRPAARQRLHAFGLSLVPPLRAGDFAQAVMELGALVCTPTSPSCADCPVRAHCTAFARGEVATIPAPTARKEPPKVRVTCLRIENVVGQVWLERRRRGLLAGTLALPMRDVAAGDEGRSAAGQLWRDLAEGVPPGSFEALGEIRHVFTHRDVTAEVFRVKPRRLPTWSDDTGLWCDVGQTQLGGGLSTFTRKTLGLAPARQLKMRQLVAQGR